MTCSLYSPRFSYILRVSPAWGFGFTSWILLYLYTIDLHLGISNPSDNKTCVHLGDQTCHQWNRKNDSERFHVLTRLLRNQIGRPGGSLELDLFPLAELDPKLFRKLINVVFLLFSLDYLVNLIVLSPRETIYYLRSLHWFPLLCMWSNLNFLSPSFHLRIIRGRRSFKSNLRFADFNMDLGDLALPLFI